MRKKIIKWTSIAFAGLAILFIGLITAVDGYIYDYTGKYILREASSLPDSTVVLIPGASVFSSGKLSDILSDRAKTAVEIYEAGKTSKILISGYKKDETYDEVTSVRNFLLSSGVSENDILVDEEGYDTYDSLYRAKNNFNLDKLIISTQYFHLPRAIYIGRSIGIDAYGIAADRQTYERINYFILREKLANLKAILEVIIYKNLSRG